MKVVISDGRVLIGEFMCTDNERNLILGNCDEYIPMSESIIVDNEGGGKVTVGQELKTYGQGYRPRKNFELDFCNQK